MKIIYNHTEKLRVKIIKARFENSYQLKLRLPIAVKKKLNESLIIVNNQRISCIYSAFKGSPLKTFIPSRKVLGIHSHEI